MKMCYLAKFKVDYKIINQGKEFVIPAGTQCIITEELCEYEDVSTGQMVNSDYVKALIIVDKTRHDMTSIKIEVRKEDILRIGEEYEQLHKKR